MKKTLSMILVLAMCITMLAACGGSGRQGESAQAEVKTEEGAKADDAAGAGKGVLVVGTNAEFPPFEYMGDDGQPDGFDMALIKEIGKRIGRDVQIENMEFSSLIAAIGNKIDIAIAGMTVDEERAQKVDFSDNYYEAVQYVLVPEGKAADGIVELKNKTIGVQLGTTGMFIAEDIEGATVTSYNKAVDAVNDLINGRVDAVIIDKNPALVFEGKFPDKIDALPGDKYDFEPEFYAIACPKGSDVVAKINEALKAIKEDGTFDKLVEQYIETN
ncbi:MAG: basic amino acid ABC transporter substrate-binding protein [Lachnospiraceae bacterium]|nr:basic amino acid ABC transporter substrate-binding protein [Lachnospiraceae bacterium]